MAEELSLVISNPSRGEFLKSIGWNKEEFMELVASITEQYKGLTYTEDQMKAAKADRAKLNAMKKAISDRRIEVKNAVMAPYNQFEREVKEVVALIEGPISMIDGQIKDYEERMKAEKRSLLEEFFCEITAEYEFLTFDKVFEQRYLNASVSLNKAKEDIRRKVERIATDFGSIESFASEKYRGAAKDVYMRTLNLSAALAEDKRLNEIDRKEEVERRCREQEAQAVVKAQPETLIGKAISSIEHQAFEKAVSGKNVANEPESGLNSQESVSESEKSVVEPPSGDAPENDPSAPQGDTMQYKASFTIYGTKAQIMEVKQYMIDNNIRFGKVEK